jgi:hypothetical protein
MDNIQMVENRLLDKCSGITVCSDLYPDLLSEYGQYFPSLAFCGSQSITNEPATSSVIMRTPHAEVLWSVTGLICEEGRQRDSYRHDHDGGGVWRV